MTASVLPLVMALAAAAQLPDTTEILALPVAGTLARDAEAGDRLAPGDLTRSGRRVRVWRFVSADARPVTVDLHSDDFDALLMVVGPGMAPLSDDDGGGACNARLTFTPAAGATYRLAVTSFAGEASGAFRLRASTRAPPVPPGSCGAMLGGDRFPAAAVRALPVAGRLTPGGTVRDSLRAGDAPIAGGRARRYVFQATAGVTATLDLRSDVFDAYLGVLGPGLSRARTDDDGGGRCDARLTVTFPETGAYDVVVSTVDADGTGGFTLTATPAAGPLADGTCAAARRASGAALRALPVRGGLAMGRHVTGTLDTAAAGLPDGTPAAAYRFRGAAGAPVTFDARSDDFDAYLFLVGPGIDRPLADDDGGGACHARLTVTLPAAGEYRVVVSSFTPSARGSFRLAASHAPGPRDAGDCGGGNAMDAAYAALAEHGTLVIGEEIAGRLDSTDAAIPDGTFARAYAVDGVRGAAATFDLVSTAFDGFILVLGPGIEGAMMDDDSGGACNPRVTLNFPATGRYRVIVNTITPGATGPFVLRATHQPGPRNPSACLQ